MKLKEANKQRTYIAAVKDLDFWLGEVESLLTSEDSGKDLASVQNLIKKHQLVEADINAHDDRIKGNEWKIRDCKIVSHNIEPEQSRIARTGSMNGSKTEYRLVFSFTHFHNFPQNLKMALL